MHQFVMAFSARRNLLSLPKTEESGEGLAALHGLRTLSCIFLIGLHRFAILALVGILQNLDYVENVCNTQHFLSLSMFNNEISCIKGRKHGNLYCIMVMYRWIRFSLSAEF